MSRYIPPGRVPPAAGVGDAERHTRAGVPSDEQVDRLSAAVDRAFAERDRLWAHARATGRDEDDQAMSRQDERADALLDQYNVAVREQMAEVERRRAENIARYRTERDEQWMNGRDAARPPLPPPPAAEPYVPPKARWTPAPLTMSDAELNAAAREWVTDCTWREDPEDLDDLTDEEVRRGVNRRYEGGWKQFVQDANGYIPPPTASKPPGDVHDRRRGRWYDEKPITNTGSTSGGTGMASSEEVRVAAQAAVEKMNEALGAAQRAGAALEESQGMFMQASEGSGKASAAEANGLLAQAVNDAERAGQLISAAIAAAEEFANQQ